MTIELNNKVIVSIPYSDPNTKYDILKIHEYCKHSN